MNRFPTRSPILRRSLLALLCATAVGQALAQDGAPAARQQVPDTAPAEVAPLPGIPGTPVAPGLPGNPRLCPNPQIITLTAPQASAGPSPATPFLGDFPTSPWQVAGSQFNQTQIDKHFGHTFTFQRPANACCQYSDGVLTVTYKALSEGASNDGGGPFRNGAAHLNMQPNGYNHIWGNAPVAVGTQVTKTYPIPASWIASGRVSFGAQDDTAVVKATLQITGCCLTPTPPAR